MTTAATALPLLGLRIAAGPVELRGITDDLLGPLAELATDIHDPDFMPFGYPWSLAPAPDMPRNVAQYHWGKRASFSPAQWTADLAVFFGGELVGSQGFSTRDYLVTRGGETGSWLGRRFQGRGIGTAMRQVICALIFDHLDGQYVTSTAFADNPSSLGVSRKTGYTDNGYETVNRLGKAAILRRIVIEPANLIRYEHELTVDGLAEFRASIGLDTDEPAALADAPADAGVDTPADAGVDTPADAGVDTPADAAAVKDG
jgi:RimJ/RimL family protein N-acetyltransferase